MLRKLTVVAVLLLSYTGFAETHSVRMKGNDLVRACEKIDSKTDSMDFGICMGYIEGVADSMESSICISPDVEAGQLIKATIKWLNDNPNQLHHDAATLVFSALVDAFPCRK